MDRDPPTGIGNREDPVRLVFDATPGAAIVVGICDLGDRFRLVLNEITVVEPDEPLSKVHVARAVWEPHPDLATSAECWLAAGRGPHHVVRVFPPDLVDEVIAELGRTELRSRTLPARVMAYFAIGMALYSDGSYEEVLSQLTDGLAWASGWEDSYVSPSKSAIFQARARLGAKPLAALFARVARPIGTTATAGGWLAGRRLVAIDGTCLDVADTAENEAFFGRPGVNKGERAAFPQARVVALAECGTHAMFAAVVGGLAVGEPTMVEELLRRLEPGMLLLADRGVFSYFVVA